MKEIYKLLLLLIVSIMINISMMTLLSAKSPKSFCNECKVELNKCKQLIKNYQKMLQNRWRTPLES